MYTDPHVLVAALGVVDRTQKRYFPEWAHVCVCLLLLVTGSTTVLLLISTYWHFLPAYYSLESAVLLMMTQLRHAKKQFNDHQILY